MKTSTVLRQAVKLNVRVLEHLARAWVEIFDFESAGTPRTPPLGSLSIEARHGKELCGELCVAFTHCLLPLYALGEGQSVLEPDVTYGYAWKNIQACVCMGSSEIDEPCSSGSTLGTCTQGTLSAISMFVKLT